MTSVMEIDIYLMNELHLIGDAQYVNKPEHVQQYEKNGILRFIQIT